MAGMLRYWIYDSSRNSDHPFCYCAAVVLTFFASGSKLSLIPVIGLLTNFYLMAQLGITNWMRFGMWLVIGLMIYFSVYSCPEKQIKENDR